MELARFYVLISLVRIILHALNTRKKYQQVPLILARVTVPHVNLFSGIKARKYFPVDCKIYIVGSY